MDVRRLSGLYNLRVSISQMCVKCSPLSMFPWFLCLNLLLIVSKTFYSEASPSQKVLVLREACEAHVKLTRECGQGLGQDRYVFFSCPLFFLSTPPPFFLFHCLSLGWCRWAFYIDTCMPCIASSNVSSKTTNSQRNRHLNLMAHLYLKCLLYSPTQDGLYSAHPSSPPLIVVILRWDYSGSVRWRRMDMELDILSRKMGFQCTISFFLFYHYYIYKFTHQILILLIPLFEPVAHPLNIFKPAVSWTHYKVIF